MFTKLVKSFNDVCKSNNYTVHKHAVLYANYISIKLEKIVCFMTNTCIYPLNHCNESYHVSR